MNFCKDPVIGVIYNILLLIWISAFPFLCNLSEVKSTKVVILCEVPEYILRSVISLLEPKGAFLCGMLKIIWPKEVQVFVALQSSESV